MAAHQLLDNLFFRGTQGLASPAVLSELSKRPTSMAILMAAMAARSLPFSALWSCRITTASILLTRRLVAFLDGIRDHGLLDQRLQISAALFPALWVSRIPRFEP